MLKPIQNPGNKSIVTRARILEETSIGVALFKYAGECFETGDHLDRFTLQERANKYLDPSENRLFQIFDGFRRFAYELDEVSFAEDEIFHALAFLNAMDNGLPEFYSADAPSACSLAIQAAFAREKLHFEDPNFPYAPIFCPDGIGVMNYDSYFPTGSIAGMTVTDLSLLTGLEEKSVRSGLTSDPTTRTMSTSGTKMLEVPPVDARKWLLGRGTYMGAESASIARDEKGLIKVPQAKDNSVFDIACRSPRSGYRIGRKGHEREFTDYQSALSELMEVADRYWRRPNAAGNMGLVKAVRWAWRTPEELGLA
ncbi:hypothetical protein [Congregibacter litoralis]|uniref:Uncharacterized protein n=1 Tax=Congregibacter litoralis KT71 TaxID=314285 RepID=A4AD65_9GAMM|nr:hypothetical protein [Congregibacter litoralis]EAQ96118.1 hypothetical protein KT71_08680 [Congregibacter litoralis KT71]